ncbi:MAG: exodeoxyribonuclease VII large subunit [Verrucomicrobiales bacterium]|jgi:exodeoxyribonuclease VII large subunit
MPALSQNRQAIPVGELTRRIRELLEGEIGEVWVEGEISNLRQHSSGHQYFSLKDRNAQMRCVWFRGNSQYSSVKLRDGLQVQAFGEVSVYEAQGQYQLVVRVVQDRGQGALQAKFEELKRKLEAEGLFSQERKRKIPAFPKTIALVTSPTGAALQDMLNILSRRAPWVRILIAPVRVQGDGAAAEIAAAVKQITARSGNGLPDIDTVVLARGGGSIEDLWNFNEEIVARAIADCPIPVVSAVGHEIDFTISDFTADLRAPTPSAAAELIVPDQAELRQRLERSGTRLSNAVSSRLTQWRRVVELLARSGAFREPDRVLSDHRQSIDLLGDRLTAAAAATFASARDRVASNGRILGLSRPDRVLVRSRERLGLLADRMERAGTSRMERARQQLLTIRKMLATLGPDETLARGYSLTLNADGDVISDVSKLNVGDRLTTKLAKGEFESEVLTEHKKAHDA